MSNSFKEYMKKLTIMFILFNYSLSFVVDNKNANNNNTKLEKDNKGLRNVVEATTTLFLSGLFDRSFFITAFMAIKYSKLIVMISASIALSSVGAISVFMGIAINKYIPAFWIDSIAVILFLLFGIKMIIEGLTPTMNEDIDSNEETKIKTTQNDEDGEFLINHNQKNEVGIIIGGESQTYQEDLKVVDTIHGHSHTFLDVERDCNEILDRNSSFKVFMKVFILIFASEIGDRSQISTIYLTNNIDKFIVLFATIISQNLLTVLAIFGGKLISTKISERNLTIIAGTTFILFGVVALYLLCIEHLSLNK